MKLRLGFIIFSTFLTMHAGSASALTVYSADIVNGEVKTIDLGANAVTTAKIQDGQVLNADVGMDAITTDKIQNGAVMNADLANSSVTDAKLGSDVTARFAALEAAVATLQAQVSGLESQLAAVAANPALDLGPYVSVDAGMINRLNGPHIIISGANLHIQDGSNSTASMTGLGNLIIGYNEDYNEQYSPEGRIGSHNLAIGPGHKYMSYGGLVTGENNQLGYFGGAGQGKYSAVVVGTANAATGDYSAVTGSISSVASGYGASVSGGSYNSAGGMNSSVSGGISNNAVGAASSITGGANNVVTGDHATISGGWQRTAPGYNNWAAGGLLEQY